MAHEHGSPTFTAQNVFTTREIAEFEVDDKRAATAIVALMGGIFIAGLLGYLGVCWWVS